MRVVALDTTTRAGSVALIEDGRVVDDRSGDGARTHALRLPGEVVTVVDASGAPMSAIDVYAVATGPGSFTGLRIGIATIQGLAFVHGRRIVGVPVLEALAHAVSADLPDGAVIAAWMDAHRQDVFSALYRVRDGQAFSRERLVEIEEPMVGAPAAVLTRWAAMSVTPAVFAGDGAEMFVAEIANAFPSARVQTLPLLAGVIGQLATARISEGMDPAAVRPFYVRRPDVEITRDEKLRQRS